MEARIQLIEMARKIAIYQELEDLIDGLQPLDILNKKLEHEQEEFAETLATKDVWHQLHKAADIVYYAACVDHIADIHFQQNGHRNATPGLFYYSQLRDTSQAMHIKRAMLETAALTKYTFLSCENPENEAYEIMLMQLVLNTNTEITEIKEEHSMKHNRHAKDLLYPRILIDSQNHGRCGKFPYEKDHDCLECNDIRERTSAYQARAIARYGLHVGDILPNGDVIDSFSVSFNGYNVIDGLTITYMHDGKQCILEENTFKEWGISPQRYQIRRCRDCGYEILDKDPYCLNCHPD